MPVKSKAPKVKKLKIPTTPTVKVPVGKKILVCPPVLAKALKAHKIICFDFETPKLNAFSSVKPLVLVIKVGPVRMWWDLRKEVPEFLKPYLESREWLKIMHSSIFDCSWAARHYGWNFRNLHDTALTEEVILGIGEPPKHVNTRAPEFLRKYSTKLNYTLARYKLAKVSKELQTSFVGMTTEELTKEQISYFNDDVEYLEKLREAQLKKAKSMDLLRTVELENNNAEVVYRMRVRGIGFDLDYWKDLARKNEAVLEKLLADLNRMTKNKVENWNSEKQVKAFFAAKGIIIASLTDLLDEDGVSVAPAYRNKSKVLDLFVKIRTEAYKYVNTYGMGWLTTTWGKGATASYEHTIDVDGRIHADIRQIVSTGRMSYSRPNLQQLPNNIEGNVLHTHRKAFIPTKGYTFVSMDFKGQELGIMAAGANYQPWIDAIRRGEDVHSIEAKAMLSEWRPVKGCTFPKKCKCPQHVPLREQAKKITFGMPYGKMPRSLAEEINRSVFEAKGLFQVWHRDHAVLSQWLKGNAERAITTYTIRTFPRINRRRNLILEPEEWRRRNQGMNTPVQGTGADMLKLALWYVYKFLEENPVWQKRAALIMCIHDQIMTEVLPKFKTEWSKILAEISEKAADEVLEVSGLVMAEIESMDYWMPKN